jgi:hypothetical protein
MTNSRDKAIARREAHAEWVEQHKAMKTDTHSTDEVLAQVKTLAAPCPFCGRPAVVRRFTNRYCVSCDYMSDDYEFCVAAPTVIADNPWTALKKWNTRPASGLMPRPYGYVWKSTGFFDRGWPRFSKSRAEAPTGATPVYTLASERGGGDE